ncbi:hypothetical protein DY000_02000975 [Brassica cretica]|uniref:Transmembrane protein n=1 Tax=Brassica cretica TaxID=69181 RepID=A0ABQ7CGA2_BRACR|nr:hypothetical protein DY000_02000975 [Brassica cretica]
MRTLRLTSLDIRKQIAVVSVYFRRPVRRRRRLSLIPFISFSTFLALSTIVSHRYALDCEISLSLRLLSSAHEEYDAAGVGGSWMSRRSGVAAREPPLHLVSCKGVLRCLSSVVTACFLLSDVSQVSSGVFVCRFGGPVLGAFSLGLTFGFGSSMAFVSGLASGYFLLARLQSRPSLKNLPVVLRREKSPMDGIWSPAFGYVLCLNFQLSGCDSSGCLQPASVWERMCFMWRSKTLVGLQQATLLNLRGVVVWSRWVEPSCDKPNLFVWFTVSATASRRLCSGT